MDLNDLADLGWASVLLVLLLLSFLGGMRLRGWLPERHYTPDMAALLQAITGMLVTFTAIVLGLLITSAKTSFDAAGADVQRYGIQIVKVDRLLREYGPDARAIRASLAAYTTGALAQFRSEHPFDDAGSRLLDDVEDGVRRLRPADEFHRRLQSDSLSRVSEMIQRRWMLAADRNASMTGALYVVLVFWLAVAFFTFGLNARANAFLAVAMSLCGVATASAMFVILDMNTPFNGLIAVSEQPLQTAVTRLTQAESD